MSMTNLKLHLKGRTPLMMAMANPEVPLVPHPSITKPLQQDRAKP